PECVTGCARRLTRVSGYARERSCTARAERSGSLMAGTALTLRANSGRTATNGEKVRIQTAIG
ncbi:hypothetical protein, partial [Verminephrobacter aporrectodeae]|uniref:hypothetical protein n=1 Tax=Verminephrobacter aporrectodeae TaxID=1110389 RepID=UPI002243405E